MKKCSWIMFFPLLMIIMAIIFIFEPVPEQNREQKSKHLQTQADGNYYQCLDYGLETSNETEMLYHIEDSDHGAFHVIPGNTQK